MCTLSRTLSQNSTHSDLYVKANGAKFVGPSVYTHLSLAMSALTGASSAYLVTLSLAVP